MKRFEVINLNRHLASFDIRSGNKFFVFALEKNKSVIKAILSEVDKKRDELVPAEYIEFENQRIKLLSEFAQRDEAGQAIVIDGRVQLKDETEFSEKFEALKEKYKNAISEVSEADKKLTEFIQEDVSVEFAKVSFKFVPDVITSEQYEAIKFFIKETDEEIQALGE